MEQRAVGDQAQELSDEELARWCQRALPGDQRPFELLVARYQRPIFGLAYRLTGDWAEADDLAQEVFVRVYRGIGRLEAPAALRSWIFQIATNLCLDALERGRRAKTVPLSVVAEPAAGHGWAARPPEPDESALSAELRRCLEETLRRMGPAERAAVVLRDVEGRPYQEIADALRLGLGAVKMRIHRARLAFQKLLQQVCPEAWRGGEP